MHPVIRILTLLLGITAVVLGSWSEWLLGLAVVLLLIIWIEGVEFHPMLKMLSRLRWLMLSILLIYLFFTPGDLLLPMLGTSSPSWQGLQVGSYRIAVLLLMVIAVSVLLQSTSKPQLVAALLWLFAPFERLGFDLERLAVRLVLTMEAVEALQNIPRAAPKKSHGVRQRISVIVVEIVDLFDRVTHHAQSLSCQAIVVPVLTAPGWRQWLLLIVLSGVFLLL